MQHFCIKVGCDSTFQRDDIVDCDSAHDLLVYGRLIYPLGVDGTVFETDQARKEKIYVTRRHVSAHVCLIGFSPERQ